jgi:hypothetical protein
MLHKGDKRGPCPKKQSLHCKNEADRSGGLVLEKGGKVGEHAELKLKKAASELFGSRLGGAKVMP